MGRITVRVAPGAHKDAVTGGPGGSLRIGVRARAERDKANEAVCRLIAKGLGVPRSAVAIVRGGTSREKVVEVAGLDDEEIRRRLAGT